jgi:hypothetical protein
MEILFILSVILGIISGNVTNSNTADGNTGQHYNENTQTTMGITIIVAAVLSIVGIFSFDFFSGVLVFVVFFVSAWVTSAVISAR